MQLHSPIIETNFRVEDEGLGTNIQDILDTAERQTELIFFKDVKGAVWQIIKRDEVDLQQLSERKYSESVPDTLTVTEDDLSSRLNSQ